MANADKKEPKLTLSSWVEGQPDDYLMCRDTGIRHPWQPYAVEAISGGRGGYIEKLKCDRCGALKVRTLDRIGRPVKTHIDYPEDFLRSGMGRMTARENASIRVEHLKRRLNRHGQAKAS